MATPCERIGQTLNELFTCTQVNEHTRIRTPYLYPDGDVVDLYFVTDGRDSTLTDFGESISWLKSQTISQKKSLKPMIPVAGHFKSL